MAIISQDNAFLTVKNNGDESITLEAHGGITPGVVAERICTTLTSTSEVDSNYHLPQVWADFLKEYPWDIFGSIVPNEIVHPESLEKLWRVFIHHINRRVYGKDYWKDKNKGVMWAIGWERQRRGAPHGHYLIAGVPDYVSLKELHFWLHLHGADFSQVEAYEKDRGAEYYMSKSSYAWKHGEIDVSHTLARYQANSWVSAKEAHEAFCRDYGANLRSPLSAYDWQA